MSTDTHSDSPSAMNNVAVKIFMRLIDEWQLDENEARQTFSWLSDQDYADWCNAKLDSESQQLLEMVSHLMAIYKLSHQVFPEPEQANAWINKPNTNLSGNSAINMIQNEGIKGAVKVRTLLEANCF